MVEFMKLRFPPGKLSNVSSLRCCFLYPGSICAVKLRLSMADFNMIFQLNGGLGVSPLILNLLMSRFSFNSHCQVSLSKGEGFDVNV